MEVHHFVSALRRCDRSGEPGDLHQSKLHARAGRRPGRTTKTLHRGGHLEPPTGQADESEPSPLACSASCATATLMSCRADPLPAPGASRKQSSSRDADFPVPLVPTALASIRIYKSDPWALA